MLSATALLLRDPCRSASRSLGAAAILAVLAWPAHASHLAMDIRPASHFSAGNVSLRVDVRNRGDEAATDVWASARLGESEAASARQPLLEAGKSAQFELELGPPPLPEGEHTIVVHVHYSDLNAYPFSAVATIPVITDAADPAPEKVGATLSSTGIRRAGKLNLNLAGLAGKGLSLRTELILPYELTAAKALRGVMIEPAESCEVVFRIRNRAGRAGSSYRVVAVMDYDYEGRHCSLVASGTVSILARRDVFVSNRILWLVAAGILAVLFAAIQFVEPESFRGIRGQSGQMESLALEVGS